MEILEFLSVGDCKVSPVPKRRSMKTYMVHGGNVPRILELGYEYERLAASHFGYFILGEGGPSIQSIEGWERHDSKEKNSSLCRE
jgi:hypothetical protein